MIRAEFFFSGDSRYLVCHGEVTRKRICVSVDMMNPTAEMGLYNMIANHGVICIFGSEVLLPQM
jgi:hypothetical protein